MTEWIIGKIIKVTHWNQNLFSIVVHASINNFYAGQYTKISIKIDGKRIQRAYSFVNSPNDKNLEFYLINIPFGKLSSKLFFMNPNSELMISKKSSGLFTLNEIPNCTNLWMLATGTAIGPYLSMLKDIKNKNLLRFKKIILVYAVRYASDLSYIKEMNDLKNLYLKKLTIITVVSREKVLNSLSGRIPNLIENRKLEQLVKLNITDNSHIMICGNPGMVRDTQNFLIKNRNMKKKLSQTKEGDITTENYW